MANRQVFNPISGQFDTVNDLTPYTTKTYVDNADAAIQSDIDNHEANTSNPHSVTKTQVGLGNVDNTSDASKPVSTDTQTALNLKSNLLNDTGAGESLIASSSTAQVKKIIAGSNITLTPGANGVTIAASGGGSYTKQSVSANYTALITDDCIVTTGTSNFAITLYAASAQTKPLLIYLAGTGTITITPNGSDTVLGETTQRVNGKYTTFQLISDGVAGFAIT